MRLLRLIERLRLRLWLKDQFESEALRRWFSEKHGVEVGAYSYGCFDPERIPRGTLIGRYCSFATTATILNADHPLGYLSLHPYLYNPQCGLVPRETIERTACVIEDDVWIGHNAVITAGCRRIGRGAAIAAGAVVTRDVAAYTLVAGVPARPLRQRFDEETIDRIEASRWWELNREELRQLIERAPDFVYRPAGLGGAKAGAAATALG